MEHTLTDADGDRLGVRTEDTGRFDAVISVTHHRGTTNAVGLMHNDVTALRAALAPLDPTCKPKAAPVSLVREATPALPAGPLNWTDGEGARFVLAPATDDERDDFAAHATLTVFPASWARGVGTAVGAVLSEQAVSAIREYLRPLDPDAEAASTWVRPEDRAPVLDRLRLQALEQAAALAPKTAFGGGARSADVLAFARFLLGGGE